MTKKVYIATPVNSRSEATIEEKREAAYKRIKEIEYRLSKAVKDYEFAEFHSSFDADIAPIDIELTKKMFGIGFQEIVVIALIVLLLFGGKKIPELMKGLGKGVRSFKDGMNGNDAKDESSERVEEKK